MSVLPVGFGSALGGYQIERSLRFNSADNAFLNRTPASAGNRKTWTWSGWVKRSKLGAQQGLIGCPVGTSDSTFMNLQFNPSDQLGLGLYTQYVLLTTQVFRDTSAWYHIVVSFDTTNATANNRCRMYVNGVEITTFTSRNNPTQNADYGINAASQHDIGRSEYTNSTCLGGYLTEVNFIDGQALTPSSFGETDTNTGVWKPKAFSGTYGTNGFYLKFADNSGTTSTTLGKDSSGNGNNWTPNNFSVTAGSGNDSLVDSPTSYGTDTGVGGEVRGNYATFNPLQGTSTLSNGNLQIVGPIGDALRASTLGLTSGKWYAEITIASALSGSASMGIAIYSQAALPTVNGTNSRGYFYTGQKYSNGTLANYGTSFTNSGDVIGIAIDLDNAKLWFSKNGTWQASGDPVAGTNAAYTDLGTTSTWFITVQTGGATGGATCHANFGQRAFAYTAPSGFKALCTQNLPPVTIGATSTTQANDYFNAVLYTGNSTARSITGVGFQPDFTWIKMRSGISNHALFDAIRGATKWISSNTTSAEATDTASLTSFDSDGFSLGTGNVGVAVNNNTSTFVAWNWKANGAGSSNTAGTITSTVSANTTSGFSIVTYTAPSSGAFTVGHGLGVAPAFIITKSRSNAYSWGTYHQSIGNTGRVDLNSTSGTTTTQNSAWNNTSPTSTVFSMGSDWAGSGITYVAYCFAPVAGYSAFGSYTGNGSTDGPFVFTNFRPAFVLIKNSSAIADWILFDTVRQTYNVVGNYFRPNTSNAEQSSGLIDIVSNGFKIRTDSSSVTLNASNTYIYAAFAETPAKFSLAR